MRATAAAPQHLITLPPRMAGEVATLYPEFAADWFVTSDPAGTQLGSGGGTAHLLTAAWQATGAGQSFVDWLHASRKLMMHAGGQSRRLPAYAAAGKAFIPVPVMRWSLGQRLDQTLVDLQLPLYEQFLAHAAAPTVAMLTAGDVMLACDGALPPFPEVDILVLGLWVTPEQARHHGVFFCPRQQPDQLAFVLQKPSLAEIRELSGDYVFLIDTGVWFLSERAVRVLLEKCGWDWQRQAFTADGPVPYELYAELGPCLGAHPRTHDPAIRQLSSAVLPLPQGRFHHFGTNRHLIESVAALHNLVVDQTKLGHGSSKPHTDQHTQNAVIQSPFGPQHPTLWIENAHIGPRWQLQGEHFLTGIPANDWALKLERGVCLDIAPLEGGNVCVWCYGIDDAFRGPLDDPQTLWLGRPAADWFAARGLAIDERRRSGDPRHLPAENQWRGSPELRPPSTCQVHGSNAPQDGVKTPADSASDIFDAPLFPVSSVADLTGDWIQWLFAAKPASNPAFADRWRNSLRLSARELAHRVDLRALAAQRRQHVEQVLLPLARNHRWSVFYRLDLQATSHLYSASSLELPPPLAADSTVEPMKRVHDFMFRAAVQRRRGQADWEQSEDRAFSLLRELILREMELQPVAPACHVLEDQIVWGRSPIRLDLAGGWTDTPPYCLEHGGSVLNVAVDLNGQPPIQVFARRIDTPELVVRSIDLGIEERVRTFDQLAQYNQIGSGFTIAKAAFALAGFLPRFHAGPKFDSLEIQLRAFGGGIEVALLCAVPKGSGLGTSSILAATLLGTLGELTGLTWDNYDLFRRTLALEQMLTSGGGWQDQAGGLLRGLKLIETQPGLAQKPTVRWLPDHFFGREYADRTLLLYYTGITRVAKEILKEIVRGMFLNSQTHLRILGEIGANAAFAADAIQRENWPGLAEAIRRSWDLNQRLDSGTNPPEVQTILDRVGDRLAACKLLGAGGGGYMLMLARDEAAALQIREILTARPPNAKARFVSLRLSETGFQVTRS